MSSVNIFEANTHLSRLVADLEARTVAEVVIARHGRPVARLVPLEGSPAAGRLGQAAGAFVVPDDIDGDNPEVARLFGGGQP